MIENEADANRLAEAYAERDDLLLWKELATAELLRADETEAQLTEARAERDHYKALAEGERERIATAVTGMFGHMDGTMTLSMSRLEYAAAIRALPAPSLPEEPPDVWASRLPLRTPVW